MEGGLVALDVRRVARESFFLTDEIGSLIGAIRHEEWAKKGPHAMPAFTYRLRDVVARRARHLLALLRFGDVDIVDCESEMRDALRALSDAIRHHIPIRNVSESEFPDYRAYIFAELLDSKTKGEWVTADEPCCWTIEECLGHVERALFGVLRLALPTEIELHETSEIAAEFGADDATAQGYKWAGEMDAAREWAWAEIVEEACEKPTPEDETISDPPVHLTTAIRGRGLGILKYLWKRLQPVPRAELKAAVWGNKKTSQWAVDAAVAYLKGQLGKHDKSIDIIGRGSWYLSHPDKP